MQRCRCTPAEAAGITRDPWHTQPHPQPAALVTIDSEPFVGETPLDAIQSWLTPNALYYARNHYQAPTIDVSGWTLVVDGLAASPLELTYPEILDMPRRTIPVTMECAGNNRVDLDPPVSGNRFQGGAVSTAIWAGVSLPDVLDRAGVSGSAVEVVFEGADSGSPVPGAPPSPYGRSLPVDLARDPDVLLAYEMNGEPLPGDHGYPLRLVVPGWYGMASVKWLTRISLVARPYEGFFQKDRYILDTGNGRPEPLAHMLVKSLFSRPRHGQVFERSPLQVAGLAWSGLGEIDSVEISQDFGDTWEPAELGGLAQRYTWRQWNARWTPPGNGHHTLMVRARDALGNVQPMENRWNRLGYAVNAVQSVCINVM